MDNLYWLPELLACVYFKNIFIIDLDIATADRHQPCLIPLAFKGFVFQICQDMELFRSNLVYIIFVEYFESEIISSSSPRCFQIKTGKFLRSLQHV